MRNIYRSKTRKKAKSNDPKSRLFFKRRNGVTRVVRDNYRNNWYATVAEVLERDEYECKNIRSGLVCHSKKDLQVHHILPLSKGGRTEKSNLITLCHECHSSRHPHMAREG